MIIPLDIYIKTFFDLLPPSLSSTNSQLRYKMFVKTREPIWRLIIHLVKIVFKNIGCTVLSLIFKLLKTLFANVATCTRCFE